MNEGLREEEDEDGKEYSSGPPSSLLRGSKASSIMSSWKKKYEDAVLASNRRCFGDRKPQTRQRQPSPRSFGGRQQSDDGSSNLHDTMSDDMMHDILAPSTSTFDDGDNRASPASSPHPDDAGFGTGIGSCCSADSSIIRRVEEEIALARRQSRAAKARMESPRSLSSVLSEDMRQILDVSSEDDDDDDKKSDGADADEGCYSPSPKLATCESSASTDSSGGKNRFSQALDVIDGEFSKEEEEEEEENSGSPRLAEVPEEEEEEEQPESIELVISSGDSEEVPLQEDSSSSSKVVHVKDPYFANEERQEKNGEVAEEEEEPTESPTSSGEESEDEAPPEEEVKKDASHKVGQEAAASAEVSGIVSMVDEKEEEEGAPNQLVDAPNQSVDRSVAKETSVDRSVDHTPSSKNDSFANAPTPVMSGSGGNKGNVSVSRLQLPFQPHTLDEAVSPYSKKKKATSLPNTPSRGKPGALRKRTALLDDHAALSNRLGLFSGSLTAALEDKQSSKGPKSKGLFSDSLSATLEEEKKLSNGPGTELEMEDSVPTKEKSATPNRFSFYQGTASIDDIELEKMEKAERAEEERGSASEIVISEIHGMVKDHLPYLTDEEKLEAVPSSSMPETPPRAEEKKSEDSWEKLSPSISGLYPYGKKKHHLGEAGDASEMEAVQKNKESEEANTDSATDMETAPNDQSLDMEPASLLEDEKAEESKPTREPTLEELASVEVEYIPRDEVTEESVDLAPSDESDPMELQTRENKPEETTCSEAEKSEETNRSTGSEMEPKDNPVSRASVVQSSVVAPYEEAAEVEVSLELDFSEKKEVMTAAQQVTSSVPRALNPDSTNNHILESEDRSAATDPPTEVSSPIVSPARTQKKATRTSSPSKMDQDTSGDSRYLDAVENHEEQVHPIEDRTMSSSAKQRQRVSKPPDQAPSSGSSESPRPSSFTRATQKAKERFFERRAPRRSQCLPRENKPEETTCSKAEKSQETNRSTGKEETAAVEIEPKLDYSEKKEDNVSAAAQPVTSSLPRALSLHSTNNHIVESEARSLAKRSEIRFGGIDEEPGNQSRRIRFRYPFPIVKRPTGHRALEEIIRENAIGVPDPPFRWVKPKRELKQLIVAAMGTSLSRRSNACGALKVLTRHKKNQLTLVRTDSFLSALSFAVSQPINPGDKDLAIDARTRAVACLRNVCQPKDNRVHVFRHPGVVEGLVKVAATDKGEGRALAVGAIALMAKTPGCREGLAEVDGLVDVLARVLSGATASKIEETDENLRNTSSISHDDTSFVSESGISEHRDTDDDAGSVDSGSSLSSSGLPEDAHPSSKRNPPPDVPKIDSIRTQTEERQDEFREQARSNACAALLHMSKQCAISHQLCSNNDLLTSIVSVAREAYNPIHTKCLEILCNFTRFPANNIILTNGTGVIETLLVATSSSIKENRVAALRCLQNMSADPASKAQLATGDILNLMTSSAMRKEADEKEVAVATIYNITTEPSAVTSITNTKNVVATLVHLAHSPESSSEVRLLACEALATISLWLQTLAGTGKVPQDVPNVPLPSQKASGWQRWE